MTKHQHGNKEAKKPKKPVVVVTPPTTPLVLPRPVPPRPRGK